MLLSCRGSVMIFSFGAAHGLQQRIWAFVRRGCGTIIWDYHIEPTQQPCSARRRLQLQVPVQARYVGGPVRDNTKGCTAKARRTFTPSIKQKRIVDLCESQNVVVSARPGAGKTAAAVAIAMVDLTRPVAILTYSKNLQIETARRLAACPMSDAFTYHSLAGRLYSTIVFNDTALRALRQKGHAPVWTGKPYEIVILDEMQDCTDNLFWLACTFIKAVTCANKGKAPRIVVLGDERQAIYQFKGADSRYLSLASSILTTLSPYPWNDLALDVSFRLSHENAEFVDSVFLRGHRYITGSHHGPKPLFLHADIFDTRTIAQYLLPIIHQYGPENTAILAPSVRTNPSVSQLTNYLSQEQGMMVAQPLSDDTPLNEDVVRDKICVSTYHQFKGSERDLVIVYGVGADYFTYFAKELSDDSCPNTTFVALTRARKQLVLIHDYRASLMPFNDIDELERTANVIQLEVGEKTFRSSVPGRPQQLGLQLPVTVSASELPRHIPDEVLQDICTKHLRYLPSFPAGSRDGAQPIEAPAQVLTNAKKQHYEAVSDLNGLAVVAAFELALLGTIRSLGKSRKPVPDNCSSPRQHAIWLCREACKHEARWSGYVSREVQMKCHAFDWLVPYLDTAKGRLEAQFSKPALLDFEAKLEEEQFKLVDFLDGKNQEHKTKLTGRADIIQYEVRSDIVSERKQKKTKHRIEDLIKNTDSDSVSIWEIKFVGQLSLGHVIQACIYAYLWCEAHKRSSPPRIILFNIRDGSKYYITPKNGITSLRKMLEEAMRAKYTKKVIMPTEEFLKQCKKSSDEVEKMYMQTG